MSLQHPSGPMSQQPPLMHRWRRFWCKPDQSYSLGDAGFLIDPETEYGQYVQPHAVALDRLDDALCLVLLGEPGIGKSTALMQERQRLADAGHEVTLLDLARVADVDTLRKALESCKGPSQSPFLILDGLDEGLGRNPNLPTDLAAALEGVDTGRTRLRISCRTLEWPPGLDATLREQWGEGVGVYELLPLRRADVIAATGDHGLNTSAFIACVHEREVTSLAIRPISLRFLLEMFSRYGTLPHSKADLFDEGTVILCSEEGALQRGRGRGNADAFRRRAIAARLAALSTFTNHQVIDRSDQSLPDVLPASAAIGDGSEATSRATYVVDAPAVADVLTGTALFAARAGTTFGWSHQSYREFLTAWYLAQHRVGVDVATALYFPYEHAHVPTPLREVAAWHATFAPDIFDLLTERDPEVLLHSDSGAVSPESSAQLTDALLERMARFEAFDSNYWRSHYQRLKHPGLASRLRPYIESRGANIIVRRAAMDIAWACGVTELIDDLIKVVQDSDENLQLRESAARALGQLAGDKVHRFFLELLSTGLEPDPNDSIRGSVLICLWPLRLDATALFQAMPAPKRTDYTGTYQRFIDELPSTLRPEDVTAAVRWVEQLGNRSNYRLEHVQRRIIDLALSYLDRRDVLEPLARILRASLKSHHGPWHSLRSRRNEQRPELSTAQRRRLADELIRIAHADEHLGIGLILSRPPLLTAEDVEWLAHHAATAENDAVAGACGALIARLYQQFGYPTEVAALDAVASVSSPAFRKPLAHMLDPVELESEAARSMKERWQQEQQMFVEDDDHPDGDDDDNGSNRWSAALPGLERAEAGDVDGWIDFVINWSQRLPEAIDAVPYWNQLSPELRARVVAVALRFLNEAEAPEIVWLDESGSYPWRAVAGRAALQFLAETQRPLLDRIAEQAWRRWCPALVGVDFPDIADQTLSDLLRRSFEHAGDELNAAIVRVVRRDNRAETSTFILRKLPRPTAVGLQALLLPLLDELRDSTFEDVLDLLVASDSAAALSRGIAAMREAVPRRAAHAARIVLRRDGGQWGTVISRMEQDRDFAESFAAAVPHDEPATSPLVSLDEQLTAKLFVTLYRLFPPERDRRSRGLVTPSEHASHLRDWAINKLKGYGTDAGLAALEWVIAQEPERKELRWYLVQARERHSDIAWQPLSIAEFWQTIRASSETPLNGTLPCRITLRKGADSQGVARQMRSAIPELTIVPSDTTMSAGGPPGAILQLQELIEQTPGLHERILSVKAGEEWVFEALRVVNESKRASRGVNEEALRKSLHNVHVLIETATDLETRMLLAAMEPLPGEEKLIVGSLGVSTYTIGKLGNYAVAHLQSDMGQEGPNGAPLATIEAISEVKPKAVLQVGVAFGISRTKQRLGDVLIARHVTSYETVKLDRLMIQERGETLRADTTLCERVKAYARTWEFSRADGSQVEVHMGQVLSGGKLVNSREFRDSLVERFPTALGGEMEGTGAYSAAFRKRVPVLLAKSICDWADGLKNARAQPFAAAAAVDLLRHVLSMPDSLKELGISAVDDLAGAASDSPVCSSGAAGTMNSRHMSHPIFDSPRYPWHLDDAMAAYRALQVAYPQHAVIDLVYRQCAAGLPGLSMYEPPQVIWKQALEALAAARALPRLCKIVCDDPAAAVAHSAMRQLATVGDVSTTATAPESSP